MNENNDKQQVSQAVSKKQRLWKFLREKEGRIASEYDGSEWTIGVRRSVPTPIRECEGLNCCPMIADAMGYVQGEFLAEVEIGGVQITGDDKITSEHMALIRVWKWTEKDSVALAIYASETVIENFEKQFPNDKRPREAIEAAKAWITNPCESTESAAWSAARSAESAKSAAWSAESDKSAAKSAARSAAWSAGSACSAAESAARSARSAESAARSAAESAESAARKKMKEKIQKWIVSRLKEMEPVNPV